MTDGPNTVPGPVLWSAMDVPALHDEHRSQPGVYVAASSWDPTKRWRGGTLYTSTDSGATWKRGPTLRTEAVVGELVTAPATDISPRAGGVSDRANTIRVRIYHTAAQLRSVTRDEMVLGTNRFLIGNEIVGAATVSLVSTDGSTGAKDYDLSDLVRGLGDTDQATTGHAAGERFVWLDGPGIEFVPTSFARAESTERWKVVPSGGSVARTPGYDVTLTGRNVRPYAVHDIAATRDGSNDVTFTWKRMPRAVTQFLSQGAPLDEDAETYLVEIMDKATATTVKRELTPTATSQAYTAAQQTTDGYTPGDSINVRIRQTSTRFLQGQPRTATV